MVGILKRMRKLKTLLDIRLGPGALILPPDIKRIHLSFAPKFNDGHIGPRKFWRTYLPRLKYHNPTVSMTVDRNVPQQGPAALTIFFAPPAQTPSTDSKTAASPALQPPSQPFEKTVLIDMKHKQSDDILAELVEATHGTQVESTPEEEEELRVLKEQEEHSAKEAAIMKEYLAKKRKEAAVLEAARRSVA